MDETWIGNQKCSSNSSADSGFNDAFWQFVQPRKIVKESPETLEELGPIGKSGKSDQKVSNGSNINEINMGSPAFLRSLSLHSVSECSWAGPHTFEQEFRQLPHAFGQRQRYSPDTDSKSSKEDYSIESTETDPFPSFGVMQKKHSAPCYFSERVSQTKQFYIIIKSKDKEHCYEGNSLVGVISDPSKGNMKQLMISMEDRYELKFRLIDHCDPQHLKDKEHLGELQLPNQTWTEATISAHLERPLDLKQPSTCSN